MITFDPELLESRRAELERETLAEGFWDDQRRAARASAELHRTQAKLDTYTTSAQFVADKRLKFETIDRVMKTCARAGFTKFRFAVAKK